MNEIEHLKSLTIGEKRYLRRFECMLCGHHLDRPGCSSVYGRCSDEVIINRRKSCLKNYKPRGKTIHNST